MSAIKGSDRTAPSIGGIFGAQRTRLTRSHGSDLSAKLSAPPPVVLPLLAALPAVSGARKYVAKNVRKFPVQSAALPRPACLRAA